MRLALFAEMVKGKPWSPATLREVGGTEGVGVAFLEETFTSVALRSHQNAAQEVLKKLLPESGADIKGNMQSQTELREASGYAERAREFDDLLRILDSDLRLITPTDPEGSTGGWAAATPKGLLFFQLTHDYLVHSLREWLTRKQRETWKGRAELRLAERSSLWNGKPENRHLPSALEWANIRLLTKKRDWTEPQRRMMRRAGRVHGVRGTVTLLLLLAATGAGLVVRQYVLQDRRETHAASLVQQLLLADTARVPDIIAAMKNNRPWVDRALRKEVRQAAEGSRQQLHLSLALLPVDPRQADLLYQRLLSASPIELSVVWKSLHAHQSFLEPRLWTILKDRKADPDQRLRAACALANSSAVEPSSKWSDVSRFITDQLLSSAIKNPSQYPALIELLRPIAVPLSEPLANAFRDRTRPESEQSIVTSILAEYLKEKPGALTDLLMDASHTQFSILLTKIHDREKRVPSLLEFELTKTSPSDATDDEKDRLAERQARAGIALIRLGSSENVWPLLKHSADPRLRSFILNWLKPLGVDSKLVVTELDHVLANGHPTPDTRQGTIESILFDSEVSMRRALILALGTYEAAALSSGERVRLCDLLLDWYRNDPDAGIHGAAEWTLRRWAKKPRSTPSILS